jgi:hypothetical protein
MTPAQATAAAAVPYRITRAIPPHRLTSSRTGTFVKGRERKSERKRERMREREREKAREREREREREKEREKEEFSGDSIRARGTARLYPHMYPRAELALPHCNLLSASHSG